ncbi:Uncharacterized protein Rs2_04899 [Raphanus sativus]|nr:Uncharacterized protein Rs2_04899 [Raphanus sativus]
MNEIRAKIDALHAFLGQSVYSAEEGEARENDTEEDVNYIGDTTPTSEGTEGRRLRSRKEKIPKNLKGKLMKKRLMVSLRELSESHQRNLLREVYFTSRLWMFFKRTRETENDIRRRKNSGGFIRDLEVHIGNAIVPVDFHVLDIKLNWNSSLLLGRAFMATVGAICDMNTNRMCLTMIDPDVHYDPVKLGKPPAKSVVKDDDPGIIAVCHCEVEYETEYSGSIDST